MARLVTLTKLTTRVQQRAGMEFASSAAIIDSGEITDNINEGIAELYSLFSDTSGQPYYLESTTFQTTSSTDTYAIGTGLAINVADFYKPRGFDVQFGQNIVVTARPFMWAERNRYRLFSGWSYNWPVAYRMLGKSSTVAQSPNDSVKFIPAPQGAFTITMWYTPTPPVLVAGGDTFDGVNGWEEYVVLSAATKLLVKQEQLEHAQVLQGMMQEQKMRIVGDSDNRDAEAPERVTDVTMIDSWLGRPSGY
jgi:hypothetical protein